MRAVRGVCNPSIAETPKVGQPPLFVNSTSTLPGARGAMIHKGKMMAKKPAMCKINTIPSIMGSLTASKVLKMIANVTAAIDSKVPCQGCEV